MNLLEKKKPDLVSRLFLAPFFLFASYFFIPHSVYVNKLLPIAGILLCLLFQKKGLYLAFALVGVDSIFQHLASPSHIWLLGFEMSLALSFWIFCLTYKQTQARIEAFEEDIQKNGQIQKSIQDEFDQKLLRCKDTIEKQELENRSLNESIKQVQLEMQSYLQLIDTLRGAKELEITVREDLSKQLILQSQKINELEFDCISYKEKLAKLENTKLYDKQRYELIEELNYFRVKQFQTQLVNEAFAHFMKEEIQKMKQKNTPLFDKEEYQKTRQLIGNYNQLKKQFQEKKETLHLVRKNLYHVTTEYEALKNKWSEKALQPKSVEKELSKEINELLAENNQLIEENRQLEKIIDHVFSVPVEDKN